LCWRLNLQTYVSWASVLPLNYIPNPKFIHSLFTHLSNKCVLSPGLGTGMGQKTRQMWSHDTHPPGEDRQTPLSFTHLVHTGCICIPSPGPDPSTEPAMTAVCRIRGMVIKRSFALFPSSKPPDSLPFCPWASPALTLLDLSRGARIPVLKASTAWGQP
jgi:hypothetical protein